MNASRIKEASGGHQVTEDYYLTAAAHLEGVFGSSLDEREALALSVLLNQSTIKFHDGFTANPDNQDAWGYSDIAIIISALCSNPDMPYVWWRPRLMDTQSLVPETELQEIIERLVEVAKAAPAVARIDR